MQIANVLVAASVMVLAALTAPVLAKNSDAQKADENSASSNCHSYEMGADGKWTALPCRELGTSPHTEHKSSAQTRDEEAR